jgi:uncharacterized protein (TIGR02271 family)
MAKTVVGLMDNFGEAQSVVRDLVDSGFERNDIGMMANEENARAHATGTGKGKRKGQDDAGKAALTGAGTGAALGGVAGFLLALSPLAIPGIGPILAAGPIAAALAGAGVGAVAGGLIGGLTNMGVPEEEAHYYAEGVRRGGTLVTVRAEDEAMADRAADIMKRHGAVDIDERAAGWREQGWSGRLSEEGPSTTGEEPVVPVVEEELTVGKRAVARGGVRVYSHVTEEPVEQSVRLREEKAYVERRPVDRPLTAGDEAFEERSYEVRETGEEPVVGKRARVVEEVSLGKEATERDETVGGTVRRSDVNVEHTGGTYNGRERRVSNAPYAGVDRRKAA